MKAIVIHEPGGPEQLKYEDVPKPAVKPGWSLVKVKAFGINHSEVFTRQGLSPSVHFPRILGIECVGEIVESTDQKLSVGQKVVSLMGEMGRDFDGSYAEYVLLPNRQIYPINSQLSWTDLAALPETYYTAFISLKNLKIDANHQVLVRGATSGVGVAFANLLKSQFSDIKVSGTTRSVQKTDQLIAAGFDQVVIDDQNHLQTTRSFDRVLELIGPLTVKDTFQHVYEGGIVCITGLLGGQWTLNDFDPIMDLAPNSYLTSGYSGNVSAEKFNDLLAFIDQYQVKVTPEKIFSLPEVPDAHRYLASQQSFGKVVVKVD